MDINEIINNYFKTDKGYMYLVDLIKEKFPTLKINEENLKTLKIETMDKETFFKTGFAGIYTAKNNTIKMFTNIDENGNKIIDYDLKSGELINSFLHELIHALTSKYEKNITFEGINMRQDDGNYSLFQPLNEGITQMITDDLLGYEFDAYPFYVNFARQIANVIGYDKLLEIYSSNNPELFVEEIKKYSDLDMHKLMNEMYYFDLVCLGEISDGGYNLGTKIQEDLLKLHTDSNTTIDKDLLLDTDKIVRYMKYIPCQYGDIKELGFGNIEEVISRHKGER